LGEVIEEFILGTKRFLTFYYGDIESIEQFSPGTRGDAEFAVSVGDVELLFHYSCRGQGVDRIVNIEFEKDLIAVLFIKAAEMVLEDKFQL
jgi:hypothetical protein